MAEGEPAATGTRSSLRVARVLVRGFALHLKMMMRSSFDGLLGVLWPLFFATIAFLMFRAGAGGESLVFASFGAAVMGIWSSTSTSAGSAMQRERWHGTLELLVCGTGALRDRSAPRDGRDVGDGPLLHGRDAAPQPLRVRRRPALRAPASPSASRSSRPSSRSARWASSSRSRSSATAPPGRSGTCSSIPSG